MTFGVTWSHFFPLRMRKTSQRVRQTVFGLTVKPRPCCHTHTDAPVKPKQAQSLFTHSRHTKGTQKTHRHTCIVYMNKSMLLGLARTQNATAGCCCWATSTLTKLTKVDELYEHLLMALASREFGETVVVMCHAPSFNVQCVCVAEHARTSNKICMREIFELSAEVRLFER